MKFNLLTSHVETIEKGNKKWKWEKFMFKCLLRFNWKSTKIESCLSTYLLTQYRSEEKIISVSDKLNKSYKSLIICKFLTEIFKKAVCSLCSYFVKVFLVEKHFGQDQPEPHQLPLTTIQNSVEQRFSWQSPPKHLFFPHHIWRKQAQFYGSGLALCVFHTCLCEHMQKVSVSQR